MNRLKGVIDFEVGNGEVVRVKHKGKGGGLSYDEYKELMRIVEESGGSIRSTWKLCKEREERKDNNVCHKKKIVEQGGGVLFNAIFATLLCTMGCEVIIEAEIKYEGNNDTIKKELTLLKVLT